MNQFSNNNKNKEYNLEERIAKFKEKIRIFWREAHELHLIFQKITNTLDKKIEN